MDVSKQTAIITIAARLRVNMGWVSSAGRSGPGQHQLLLVAGAAPPGANHMGDVTCVPTSNRAAIKARKVIPRHQRVGGLSVKNPWWVRATVVFGLVAAVMVVTAPAVQGTEQVWSVEVDSSGESASRWASFLWTAPADGSAGLTVSWAGSANVRAELRTHPTNEWVDSALGTESPKRLEAEVTAGETYRIAVWSMSGTASVSVVADDEPGGGTVVAAGSVDAAGVSSSRWTSTTWEAPSTGLVSLQLDWDGPANLRIDVRRNGTWVTSRLNTDQPKVLDFDAVAGASYDIAVWSMSGAADFTVASDAPTTPPPPTEDDRPNILIILTDDQRRDSMEALPQITDWFSDGTTFTQGYVPTPSCCPSRATLMTGQYVHNNGTVNQSGPAFDESRSLAAELQQAGYLTGHVGKYVHYYDLDERAPNWDRWMYFQGGYFNRPMNFDGTIRTTSGYSTNITFDTAIGFVDDWEANDDQPWMMQVAPVAPHRANNEPPPPDTPYVGAAVPEFTFYPNSFETNISDKPPFIYCCDYGVERIQETRDAMLRALYSVDDGVDRLLSNLEANGELDNTLVFFLSDNGWLFGEHQLHEKFLPYHDSVGVPFLMRWPGNVPAGAVDDRFVGSHDIAPTALAAAGVPVPEWMDGSDILSGHDRDVRLTEYFQDDSNIRGIPDWASITTDIYQYTEYYQPDSETVRFREYYDLIADPWQLTNLLGDNNTRNDPDTAALSQQLARHRTCAGVSCS